MKNKIIYIFAIAASFVAASCSSDNDSLSTDTNSNTESSVKMVSKSFGVSTPSETTRAFVSGVEQNEPKMHWDVDNDQLSVWGGKNSEGVYPMACFTCDEIGSVTSNYGKFSGDVVAVESGKKYYMMYPYQSDATLTKNADDNKVITAKIPVEQHAVSGSFDPAAAICTGHAEESITSLSLTHACAFLKIKLTSPCTSVEVTGGERSDGKGTECLAGAIKVTDSSSGTALDIIENVSSTTVKLVPAAGESVIPAGTYLIAIIPAAKFPTSSVVVTSSTGATLSGTIAAGNLSAGFIYNMGTVGF